MKTTESPYAIDRFIQSLREAQTELETFRVRLALGQADAKDKFEDIKKEFSSLTADLQAYLKNSGIWTPENEVDYQRAVEEIRVQLALGLAEGKDAYAKVKDKLKKALSDLESILARNPQIQEFEADWTVNAEKVKIKLEVLYLQYGLAKLEIKSELEQRNRALSHQIAETEARLKSKADNFRDGAAKFRTELSEAFDHLRKAFQF